MNLFSGMMVIVIVEGACRMKGLLNLTCEEQTKENSLLT